MVLYHLHWCQETFLKLNLLLKIKLVMWNPFNFVKVSFQNWSRKMHRNTILYGLSQNARSLTPIWICEFQFRTSENNKHWKRKENQNRATTLNQCHYSFFVCPMGLLFWPPNSWNIFNPELGLPVENLAKQKHLIRSLIPNVEFSYITSSVHTTNSASTSYLGPILGEDSSDG